MITILKNNWHHLAILGIFVFLTLFYFSPEFDGYTIRQHDVEAHKGMSNEIVYHREVYGEEPQWTNSMFGGMPAVQVSTIYEGNIFQRIIIAFLGGLGVPAAIFLLHLIGFYILSLCLKIKPWIGLFGSIAFALASYEIVILQAGHNSKATAVAFMAPVLGAFIMAYRRNWKWGAVLSALFMSFELAANHLQITYYLGFLLLGLGIYFFVEAIMKKNFKSFMFATAGLIGGYAVALLINYGNLTLTNDYAKYSMRGVNDVTIGPDGEEEVAQSTGLDKDYITNWSYGIGESFTLISPYVKGSHTATLGTTTFAEKVDKVDLTPKERKTVLDLPVYWGEQPMTSGPVYLGVLSVFLALLGLIFLKDRLKWVIFGISVLALMLSWGKNFMGLTDFFIDNFPMYNKFRTVTMILVLLELCIPLLAIWTLQRLYENREEIKQEKKKFIYFSSGFLAFILIVLFMGLGDNYTSQGDYDIQDRYRNGMLDQIANMDPAVLKEQYGIDMANTQQVSQFVDMQMEPIQQGFEGLKKVRKEIFVSSMTRTFVFSLFGIGVIALFFFSSISPIYPTLAASALLLIDLVGTDRNYLGTETQSNGKYVHWIEKEEAFYPLSSTNADEQILQMEVASDPAVAKAVAEGEKRGKEKAENLGYVGAAKRRVVDSYRFQALNYATNYRVFDFNGGWNSSRPAYFHKSLGGYHGAKLRNIQNLFDFHISRTNNKVLDMMNVKYIIQGENMRPNPTALGGAWFVQEVKTAKDPNEEILSLGSRFKLTKEGEGQLVINGSATNEISVFGGEEMLYVQNGDSINIPLSNGIMPGMEVYFVADALGNTNLVPKQTLEIDTASSFKPLVKIVLEDRFEPATTAVMLSDEASKLSKKKFDAQGTIKTVSYRPNHLTYESDSKSSQLAVFSEIYYPDGWTALVDGKEQDILKVNYLLRGLELTPGKHKIEFLFDLPKLHKSNTYARIGTGLILLLIILLGWMEYKGKKVEATK
ncbi:MAG: hypothetical protein EP333_10190 [Bacteroidetes bacterium]|nr:MAG: hypothetical protein EP333_10190 [Bacteroidota bacterium]